MKTKAIQLISKFTLATFLIFVSSCSNESLDSDLTDMSKPSIYELINNTQNASASRNGAPKKGDDAIATIAINGGFTQLVAALSYVDSELETGLVNLFLNGTDQYTVFAPTDDAFMDLYTTLGVNGIDELPADLVLNVLLYHVTEGRRASNSVVPKNGYRNVQTLLELPFQVSGEAEIMAIGNTANFVTDMNGDLAIDISASNGIIHVIDTVILPIVVE